MLTIFQKPLLATFHAFVTFDFISTDYFRCQKEVGKPVQRRYGYSCSWTAMGMDLDWEVQCTCERAALHLEANLGSGSMAQPYRNRPTLVFNWILG